MGSTGGVGSIAGGGSGNSQKYSLKWNDFGINVASTFRDLHSRHDFVDVTLACSDGSTLEAHKVILSSVSAYFRDILKVTPAKHPIIILKDTGRDEAQAMLEFAYTGEVNVAQDLLPTLLHTARAYRIKGLDKVESPVGAEGGQPNPPPPPPPDHWAGESSGPPTRPHTPSSEAAPPTIPPPPAVAVPGILAAVTAATQRSAAERNFHIHRERDSQPNSSSPPSLPSSQPPTREASPAPPGAAVAAGLMLATAAAAGANARTPPPKRWKRSFDMTHPINKNSGAATNGAATPGEGGAHPQLPLPMNLAEKYFQNRHNGESNYPDSQPSKRFCHEGSNGVNGSAVNGGSAECVSNSDSNGSGGPTGTRHLNGNSTGSNGATSRPALHYSQSMPTSPTMFDRQNDRLAMFRHHLAANDLSRSNSDSAGTAAKNGPTSASANSSTTTTDNAIDYRCYPQQPKIEPEEFRANGDFRRASMGAGGGVSSAGVGFRPESAPTVLDMSPEGSVLSRPPSVAGRDEEHMGGHFVNSNGDENGYNLTPDAMGRYSCDECGKIFKHPGSLQHHRHIHRGTHRCPSCGKVFSRRWDMERHLNKSKYGCPANRFSTGSAGSGSSGGSSQGQEGRAAAAAAAAAAAINGINAPVSIAAAIGNGHATSPPSGITAPPVLPSVPSGSALVVPPSLPAITSAVSTAAAHLELLAQASSAASAAAAAREAGVAPPRDGPVSVVGVPASVSAAVSAVVAANNAHNTTV